MILERLKELGEREENELPPLGYDFMRIDWLIELDYEGNLLGVIPVSSKKEKDIILKKAPNINILGKRTSGNKAGLLADNAQYVLGKSTKGKTEKPEKITERHILFTKTVKECAKCANLKEVEAVEKFYEKGLYKNETEFEKVDGGDYVTFSINGIWPIDFEEVREYWLNSQMEFFPKGKCMICEKENVPLVETHPIALKSIPGGQSSGVLIISANDDAFESYGLKSSLIAPICLECAEQSHKPVNMLISDDQSRFRLGDKVIFLFWTRGGSFSPTPFFNDPNEDEIKKLFEAPFSGKRVQLNVEAEKFYTLALSGSGGRAVVRDWIDVSLNDVHKNLRNYFNGQKLEKDGKNVYQRLKYLANATLPYKKGKPNEEKLAVWIPQSIVEYALKRQPLPICLLTTAVRRCSIGWKIKETEKRYHVNDSHASLVKLTLYSILTQKGLKLGETWMIKLDTEFDNPAYLYGRLFFVLEQIQDEATGGSGVERTFGSALMSPVNTLPRLLARAKQAHLPKLRRDKRKAFMRYEKLLNEIQGKLSPAEGFLTRLRAEEQGYFILGYWHQSAQKWADIEEAKQRKAENQQQELISEENN